MWGGSTARWRLCPTCATRHTPAIAASLRHTNQVTSLSSPPASPPSPASPKCRPAPAHLRSFLEPTVSELRTLLTSLRGSMSMGAVPPALLAPLPLPPSPAAAGADPAPGTGTGIAPTLGLGPPAATAQREGQRKVPRWVACGECGHPLTARGASRVPGALGLRAKPNSSASTLTGPRPPLTHHNTPHRSALGLPPHLLLRPPAAASDAPRTARPPPPPHLSRRAPRPQPGPLPTAATAHAPDRAPAPGRPAHGAAVAMRR